MEHQKIIDKTDIPQLARRRPAGGREVIVDFIVFIITFGLGNLFAYGFLLLAGRHLGKFEFGIFNALVSVITMVGFIAAAFQVVSTKFVAESSNTSSPASFIQPLKHIFLFCGSLIALLGIFGLVTGRTLGSDLSSWILMLAVCLSIFVSAISSGYLAGSGFLRHQAYFSLCTTTVRFFLGWFVFSIGMGIAGGMASYLLAQVLFIAMANYWINRSSVQNVPEVGDSEIKIGNPFWWQPALMAVYLLGFLPFTLDQILVQAFSPQFSGDYAALATISKLVFYGGIPIISVAYPRLLERQGSTKSHFKLLAASIIGVITIAGIISTPIIFKPVLVLNFFFDQRFADSALYAPLFAVGAFFFVISALLIHYLIILGEKWVLLLNLVCVSLQIGLFSLRCSSLEQVVQNQLVVNFSQFVLLALYSAIVLSYVKNNDGKHRDS